MRICECCGKSYTKIKGVDYCGTCMRFDYNSTILPGVVEIAQDIFDANHEENISPYKIVKIIEEVLVNRAEKRKAIIKDIPIETVVLAASNAIDGFMLELLGKE